MARRRHKKKNYKGEKAQLLKGEIWEASEILIRSQDADERIFIPETVELPDCGRTVDRSQNKSNYTEVPAIIKQWQKRRVQPAERPDAEDDVKKQESGGSSCADRQGYRRSIGEEKRTHSDKQRQVERDSGDQHNIVDAFLAIPSNGLILMAHGVAPEGSGRAEVFPDWFGAGHEYRNAIPPSKRAGSNNARTKKMRRWILRRG